jgi:hypothetical protein
MLKAPLYVCKSYRRYVVAGAATRALILVPDTGARTGLLLLV